jgi:hypothetical protein
MSVLKNIMEFSLMRPDGSGQRGGGVPSEPISRASNYPYDQDNDDFMYGEPGPYDRGSGDYEPSHAQLTPKDTSHSSWDMDEAMGTPMNFSISSRAGAEGGGPLASSGWSHNPPKDWDEDEQFESFDMNSVPPTDDETDFARAVQSSVEKYWKDNSLSDPDDLGGSSELQSMIITVGTPEIFSKSVDNSMKTRRAANLGLMPKESVWIWLENFAKPE